jgi:hypothetical protein
VANPESLAGYTDPDRDDYEFEDLWGASQEAYEELTGEEMPVSMFSWPVEPRGKRWDFDDGEQVARRLPQLAGIYPS